MSAFHFGLPINRKELITITNSIGNQRELNTTLQTVPPNLYTEPESCDTITTLLVVIGDDCKRDSNENHVTELSGCLDR